MTAGQIGNAPDMVNDKLPSEPEGATALEPEQPEEELEEMQHRLEALRS